MNYRNGVLCVWVVVCSTASVLDLLWFGSGQNNTLCKKCACDPTRRSLSSSRDQNIRSLELVHTIKKSTETVATRYKTANSSVKGLRYLDKLSRERYEACEPAENRTSPLKVQCRDMTFQESDNPVVALVSPPGSGNTWVRYLLEQATGIYTGSIYCDGDLKAIYPGERIVSGNVIVVKTHRYTTRQLPPDVQAPLGKVEYDKAILLLRNPYNCILSEANRRWNTDVSVSSHIGLASDTFLNDVVSWDWFVQVKSGAWLAMLRTWLEQDQTPVMIVEYEKLMTDLKGEMQRMFDFLGQSVPKESLDCVIKNANGSLRRTRHLNMDPFSKDNKAAIDRVLEEARPILQRYNISYSMPPLIANTEPLQRTN